MEDVPGTLRQGNLWEPLLHSRGDHTAPGSRRALEPSRRVSWPFSSSHPSLFPFCFLAESLQPLSWPPLSSCGDTAICELPCLLLTERCWFVTGLHVARAVLELLQASLEFCFANLKEDWILPMISFPSCSPAISLSPLVLPAYLLGCL